MTFESAISKEIPKGWTIGKLDEIVEILDSRRIPVNLKERERRFGIIPYYGATGQVGWIDDFIFDEELVLLGEDGAPFLDPFKNKAYLIKDKSWVNNHAHVLRGISTIISNVFLCHYLNQIDYHAYVSGTTRFKLNQAPMRKIPVLIPPYNEQKRIVTKLDELFSRLDAGIDSLKKAQVQLKQYRQSVLKSAFEGKLTEKWRLLNKNNIKPYSLVSNNLEKTITFHNDAIEQKDDLSIRLTGWGYAFLGDICEKIEIIDPKKTPDKEYKYIEIASIDNHQQKIVNVKTILGKNAPLRARQLVKQGDILFSTVRTYLRQIAIVDKQYDRQLASTGFCVIRPLSPINNKLIFYGVQNNTFINAMTRLQRGVSYPAVRESDIFSQTIPIPSILEQQQIVDEIEHRYYIIDNNYHEIEKNLMLSNVLRRSLLKQTFEGKLVPQDPSDEPAQLLLEQIRKERSEKLVYSEHETKKSRKKQMGLTDFGN